MAYNFFPSGYQPAQFVYPTQPNAYPTQMNVGQNQPTQTSMIWIQGEAAAKSYLVAPNTTVVLWDSERPSIYIKSTDATGIPKMRIFDYKERTAEEAADTVKPDYATKEEVASVKAELDKLKAGLAEEYKERVKEKE